MLSLDRQAAQHCSNETAEASEEDGFQLANSQASTIALVWHWQKPAFGRAKDVWMARSESTAYSET